MKNEMGWTCGTYGRQKRCPQGFVVKPDGKRPLARPRCRREENIKIDYLKKRDGVFGLDLSGSGYRQVAGFCDAVMKLRVPQNAQNFLTSQGSISFSRRTLLHVVSWLVC
jgi:hypothetical protein